MKRTQTPLQPLIDGHIWVCERPVKFSGAWLRSRSLIVKLADGNLWVHSPPEPTDELREAIDALGAVSWLVVPNKFHHLQTPRFAEAYPAAKVVGPQSVLERNSEIEIDIDIADPAVAAQLPGLEVFPLAGVPFLDETVFFHRSSGTLIGADLAMSATRQDHWSWRLPARILGAYGKLKVPPDVRFRTRACAEAAHALEAILALPIERISVAHTDPITEDPIAKLARAWKFVLAKFPAQRNER